MKKIILSAFVAVILSAGNAFAQPAAVKKIKQDMWTSLKTVMQRLAS